MIKHILAFLIGSIITFGFYSCNDVNSFTLGQDLVDVKANVIVVDTCTIKAYTIKSDSVVTSGFGTALVGKYLDNKMANITINSSSYFDIGLPTTMPTLDPNLTYAFDSLTLCLHYSHYSYGDTTKPYTIQAYRLTEKIDSRMNSNGYLFNTSSVSYQEKLGEKTVKPRPSFHDSIQIKLDNTDLGSKMLEKIKYQDAKFDNVANFTDYFRGIALISGSSNNCVLGFAAADTSTYMRLYYHVGGAQYMITFGLRDKSIQFNQIIPDFSTSTQSVLVKDPLKKLDNRVISDRTGNQTYVQASTGLMTRLEFPYVKTLLGGGKIKILSAELILAPVRKTYYQIPLPSSVVLSVLDNANINLGNLTTEKGVTLTPLLTIDYQYNERTSYTFDLTSFISSVFQQTDNNLVPTLGISIASDKEFSSLDRVIFDYDNQNTNTTKLKITYLRY